MLSIKRKLSSKSGASMLLAMVFLMFCLFIGGSVLAAATANGSRVEHLKNDQQDYLSQRSAMLLMADMLTGTDGQTLAFIITDLFIDRPDPESDSRIVNFSCSNLPDSPNILQKLLCECIITNYPEDAPNDSKNFSGLHLSSLSTSGSLTGTIAITDPTDNTKILNAKYTLIMEDANCDLSINFIVDPDNPESTYVSLFMDGKVLTGTPNIVNIGEGVTTTTTTTSITWENPVVKKGGA